MTTTIDLGKIMGRVQALLAKADSTEYPEEATALRAKAEQFMREYRIAEEDLIATDQVEILPEVHWLWLGPLKDSNHAGRPRKSGGPSSYYQEWYQIADAACRHAGVRMHHRWRTNQGTAEYGLWAGMVGYAGDLRLAEMVYTAARIVFGERLEPKPDPNLSDQVNAYRLRSAGINRDRAAQLLWGETSHARAAKIGALYKAECALRGEEAALDGRGISADLYRGEFARSFVDEFERRLRAARDAADSNGGALVLAGRAERVQEAFYNAFPELRPQPKTDVAVPEKAPKRKGRAPKPYWQTAAYRREQERRQSSTGQAARAAGATAAREVELDRPTPAGRVSPGPRGELAG